MSHSPQPVPPATEQPSFTPGPWFWSDEYTTADERKTWSLVGARGYGILSCDGVVNSPQGLGDHANARLIAAAPDLYAACQELLRLAIDPKSTGYIVRDASGNITKLRRDNDIIADARAALAKAGVA